MKVEKPAAYRRMTPQELEDRLIRYAVRCTLLCRELPTNQYFDAKHVAGQLIRSATHPAFHYPEARAAESTKDLIHKQKVLLKELRESKAQLTYIECMAYFPVGQVTDLLE
ncbi:MAG: four helix bundle protein, partial [Bacteroidota bacterium]